MLPTVSFAWKLPMLFLLQKPKSSCLSLSSWKINLSLCRKDIFWAFSIKIDFFVVFTSSSEGTPQCQLYCAFLTEISLVGQLLLANQMCFVIYNLSLNTHALQTSEDTKSKNEKVFQVSETWNQCFWFWASYKMLSFTKFRTSGIIFWMVNGTDNQPVSDMSLLTCKEKKNY